MSDRNVKGINFYLRIYLLSLSILMILDLFNSPTIKLVDIITLLRPWVITTFLYSIMRISLSKKNKRNKFYFPFLFSGLITLILIFPTVYLKIPSYVIYIVTISLYFIYYLRFFDLKDIEYVFLGSLPYLISIIIIIKGIELTHMGTLNLIVISLLFPVIFLDNISWEFKRRVKWKNIQS